MSLFEQSAPILSANDVRGFLFLYIPNIGGRENIQKQIRYQYFERARKLRTFRDLNPFHQISDGQASGSPCASPNGRHLADFMLEVKDTLRATVRIGYDGRVSKTYRGPDAEKRFDTEVRVLRYLEARNCPFVPRLLEENRSLPRIVTTNCGSRIEHLDEGRMKEIYDSLLPFGVRHDDAEMRNITYRQSDGRFCVIDFEFATILEPEPSDGPSQ
jgi:hypothetical protein